MNGVNLYAKIKKYQKVLFGQEMTGKALWERLRQAYSAGKSSGGSEAAAARRNTSQRQAIMSILSSVRMKGRNQNHASI